MELILEVVSGPESGRRLRLRPRELRQVGGDDSADFVLRRDAALAAVHFDLMCDGASGRLRPLDGSAVRVNGREVSGPVAVRDGDQVVAGQTTFRVRLRGEAAPAGAASPPAARRAEAAPAPAARPAAAPPSVLDVLGGAPALLYALLDAARAPAVPALLRSSGEEFQSLYEGPKGEEMADFAPYLVRLPAASALLPALVAQGWGKSWGVYLTCGRPFKDVRRHFRHFLLVELHDGREVYFRFYDPRVLGPFLPTCGPEQVKEFFGPVECFYVEGDAGRRLTRFAPGPSGTRAEAVAVAVTT